MIPTENVIMDETKTHVKRHNTKKKKIRHDIYTALHKIVPNAMKNANINSYCYAQYN